MEGVPLLPDPQKNENDHERANEPLKKHTSPGMILQANQPKPTQPKHQNSRLAAYPSQTYTLWWTLNGFQPGEIAAFALLVWNPGPLGAI